MKGKEVQPTEIGLMIIMKDQKDRTANSAMADAEESSAFLLCGQEESLFLRLR